MTRLKFVKDSEDVDDLLPLIEGYHKINPEEKPEAVLLLIKILIEHEDGVVIKALDKGEAIGYVMGAVVTDVAGRVLNVTGIFADKVGTGSMLLEGIEAWAKETKGVHLIRSVTRRHPEAMARLFDAKIAGYVLEKEF